MTLIRRVSVAAALATAALVLATPAAAQADSGGADFGQHVRTCAQTMGFTGSHNPGMHQGYTGWDGMADQM
jgi:hypothetical protein